MGCITPLLLYKANNDYFESGTYLQAKYNSTGISCIGAFVWFVNLNRSLVLL